MKRLVFFVSLLVLIVFAPTKQTAAAACDNISQYGTVSVNIPALVTVGTYNIWTRMQAPDSTHNQYRLEINGNSCFAVGGSSITPGQWTWVSFQDNNQGSKVRYDFDSKTQNSAKLIGIQAGVKVDRLLLIKTDCVPVADGSNCQSSSVPVEAIDTAGASQVPPPSSGPVGGLVVPSSTISQNLQSISNVVYAVDGKQLPTASGQALDTTLLSNGSHTVAMRITKTNGTVINEVTTLNVENAENAFSPLRRWIRLNQHTLRVWGLAIGSILLITTLLLFIRQMSLRKRLLEFKGF